MDDITQSMLGDELEHVISPPAPPPHEHETMLVTPRPQAMERAEERHDVLARLDRADEENVGKREPTSFSEGRDLVRCQRPKRSLIRGTGSDAYPALVDVILGHDFDFRRMRPGEDMVGMPGGEASEPRHARSLERRVCLGEAEKAQVVNRHHLPAAMGGEVVKRDV